MSAELLVANLAAHWIQAGVLSLVTVSVIRLLRVREPRLTLAALQLVLVLIVLLPWMQRWRTVEPPAPVAAQATATLTATVTVDASAPRATPAPPLHLRRPIEPAAIALSVIAAGIVLRLAWLLLGVVRLRRFARQTHRIAPPEFADDLQSRVGAAARYLEHPTAGSPSTFGIFRPRVVLPARFSSLSASHQQGALCHELIHVKRRDVAAALAEEILMAVLWFHPWMWVIRRRIRVAREQVVDLRVLELTGDRAEYVRCLIEMSGHDLVPHLSHAGAAMVRSNELRARVDAIFQEVRMSHLRFVTVSATLAAVVGMAAWAAVTQAPLYAMAPQTAPTAFAALTLHPVERASAAVSSAPQTIQTVSRQSLRGTPPTFNGNPVTLSFTGADLRLVLRTFGEISGLNVEMDPNLEGRVNLSLNKVPWDQALDVILQAQGLGYQIDGTSIRIAPPSVLAAARLAQTAQQPGALGQMRRLIKVAYADYPSEALDKQISGVVKATIVVNAAGEVTMADVTSGPPELRSSAFKSFMGLKYSPGPDTIQISIALEYRLDPQGWGVRVIQDSGTIGSSTMTPARLGMQGPVPAPGLGVPVRVGGDVAPPKNIKTVLPVYPPVAQQAKVQGVVILEAVIDEAGNVSSTKVLRSIPLLDQAAIEAVMQWQFVPTLLNGVAVPVVMTVTVNFTSDVTLKIGLPNGATPSLRILDERGLGTVDLPNVGKFGFASLKTSSPTGRSIAIYQMGDPGSPPQLLGNVQVELNGGVVQSPTTPSFGIELVRLP